jgi:hypothetical protein
VKAADTTAPPGIRRTEGYCAALFIARRTTGDDRIALWEACGLWPYEPAQPKHRISNTLIPIKRPGQ